MEENINKNKEGKIYNSTQYKDLIDEINGVITLEQLNSLIEKAISAKKNTYSPYSNFPVGCCLLTIDDKYISGKNIRYYYDFKR